jgi:hypothetical protein
MNLKKVMKMAAAAGWDVSRQDADTMARNKHIRNLSASRESVGEMMASEDAIKSGRIELKAAGEGDFSAKLAQVTKLSDAMKKVRGEGSGAKSAKEISLAQAVRSVYDMSVTQYLRVLYGISSSDTIVGAIAKMGYADATLSDVQGAMHSYGREDIRFSSANTRDFGVWRFLIPEMFLTAIELGYNGAAKYLNWIAGTEVITSRTNTSIPFIYEGDVMPYVVAEGAEIPLGELAFGNKTVKTKKVGIGIKLTSEVLQESTINLVSLFLSLVGGRISRGADAFAMKVLIEGDQSDLSEYIPIIGVNNPADGLTLFDIDNAYTALDDLNQTPTQLIARRMLAIDDLNKNYPARDQMTLRAYAGELDMSTDTFAVPANLVILLDASKAMMELTYRGMRVDSERSAKTDTEYMYVTKEFGFSILKRDARLGIDITQDYATVPLPEYMDAENATSQSFKS